MNSCTVRTARHDLAQTQARLTQPPALRLLAATAAVMAASTATALIRKKVPNKRRIFYNFEQFGFSMLLYYLSKQVRKVYLCVSRARTRSSMCCADRKIQRV